MDRKEAETYRKRNSELFFLFAEDNRILCYYYVFITIYYHGTLV